MKKLLIIVDMQNDFITGSLANIDAQAIVDPICQYLTENKNNFEEVVLTRDTHKEDYLKTPEGKKLPVEHCIHGTPGWCVHDKIRDTLKTLNIPHAYIDKTTFGYKYWGSYGEGIQGYNGDVIEICGTCTDICVVSNALILKNEFPKKEIRILSNLCAGLTPELHQAALDVMKSCQCEITKG